MLDIGKLSISGAKSDGRLIWLAVPEERLVACHDPLTRATQEILRYEFAVWDVCPAPEGLWMMTAGGRLGRQLVLWSAAEGREIRKFNCPDGAGAGVTLFMERLWLTHRHNRKLFCLDPENGKLIWTMRTERESFSPASYANELWLVEADLGPLGHWNTSSRGSYFFSRYDPAREAILERRAQPFIPRCLAVDATRFWYSREGESGLFSAEKNPR
ncbi:MAG TPA: hypothetical protein VNL14_19435 [Candidatus Acidoferrales bacterium]|nr:hypothetical protein [Candidatus Acidoferrales bacterium]